MIGLILGIVLVAIVASAVFGIPKLRRNQFRKMFSFVPTGREELWRAENEEVQSLLRVLAAGHVGYERALRGLRDKPLSEGTFGLVLQKRATELHEHEQLVRSSKARFERAMLLARCLGYTIEAAKAYLPVEA